MAGAGEKLELGRSRVGAEQENKGYCNDIVYLFSVPDKSWKHGGDQIHGYTAGKRLPPKQYSSSSYGDAAQSDEEIVILSEGEMNTLPIPADRRVNSNNKNNSDDNINNNNSGSNINNFVQPVNLRVRVLQILQRR